MINRSSGVAWSTYEAMHVFGWGLGREQQFKSALLQQFMVIVFDKTTRKPLGMVGERTNPPLSPQLRGV